MEEEMTEAAPEPTSPPRVFFVAPEDGAEISVDIGINFEFGSENFEVSPVPEEVESPPRGNGTLTTWESIPTALPAGEIIEQGTQSWIHFGDGSNDLPSSGRAGPPHCLPYRWPTTSTAPSRACAKRLRSSSRTVSRGVFSVIHFPVLRWGSPYTSLEVDQVVHFDTGEAVAEVSQANAGLVSRDMRKAARAREVLREIPTRDLLAMVKKAAAICSRRRSCRSGRARQTPDQFVRQQSATTGLPEHMCRMNMEKLRYVLDHLDEILALADPTPRSGDPLARIRRRGRSHAQLPGHHAGAGMVLPSNSPGVHSLWLPIIPLQIGLVLKPGPQEPWTPWRMVQAFFEAGVFPVSAMSLYPGLGEVGAAVLNGSVLAV